MKETAQQSQDLNKREIEWNNFNYPCCIKVFHYVPQQTPEIYRREVAFLRINHILILASCLLNFLTNIIATGQGLQQGGIRIAISVFLFLFFIPISFYSFIIPYKIIMGQGGKSSIFYVLSGLIFLWFLIWSIADFADANGFIMVKNYSNIGYTASAFFAGTTAISMIVIAILAFFNAFYFCRRKSNDQ